ncbi:hypothetical protein SAMN02982929_05415 [Saccharopolyspora kobensis]|uniref:Uncharacterized protein n=1 Tax=Saccharopolyspora kobensis TaxID=146035 RepID=A0A1H6E1F5_9PSEU|nr:hypothetical protein [Saccharopolyspora kobensis]SEG91231.1 hypothetical protein SAMN02982929_05415 [Saccharopolyspora kobensis]SFF14382.1 hypothetical protein SAMN05216506_12051 [Saccharopolyspora kobensis]
MSEELLRESLRAAVADEPPLGVDPDAVAAEGRRRQRRRRAVIGAAVATLIVAAGAVAVPGTIGQQDIAPAVPQVRAIEPIDWPPVGAVRVELSQAQLVAQGEQIERYLDEAIVRDVPGARAVDVSRRGPVQIQIPSSVIVSAPFDRAAVGGQDWPVLLSLRVFAPGAVDLSPAQECESSKQFGARCYQHVQDDGSIVLVLTSRPAMSGGGEKNEVRHYRTDGTVVMVNAFFNPRDPATVAAVAELREGPMDLAELTALATDPRFALIG